MSTTPGLGATDPGVAVRESRANAESTLKASSQAGPNRSKMATTGKRHSRNAEAAREFEHRTGIPTYARNVADAKACSDGVARVRASLGPVEVLVNNAGITRDAMLHKMTLEQWREVIDVDLGNCFNMCRAAIEGMRERRFGRHH